MGGHANRHVGYRRLKDEYKCTAGRFKEYAEGELDELSEQD